MPNTGSTIHRLHVTVGRCRAVWATALIALTVMPAAGGVETGTADEQEIRRIHAGLDAALAAGDAESFDRVFAPDYFFSHHFGYKVDRDANLAYLRSLRANPKIDILEATSDDLDVRVHGNLAYLTAAWRTVGRAAGDPDAIRHVDTGRYTGIYERRGGAWMLSTEHMSEALHDPERLAAEVRTAGRQYVSLLEQLHNGRTYQALVSSGDLARLERTLAIDFTYTAPNGRLYNRAEELEAYRTLDATIRSAEILQQHLRAIDNGSVLESITVLYEGDHAGKPYRITKRSTLVWVWRDFRWQIASDHSSQLVAQ